VLDPGLRIKKEAVNIIGELHARRIIDNQAEYISAQTIGHNWVEDKGVIYPLPVDVSEVLGGLLEGIDPEKMKLTDVLGLMRLKEPEIPIDVDDTVFTAGKEIAETMGAELSVPGLVDAKLYPYQTQGVIWMRNTINYTGGLILADEMGLGKTMQIISLFLLDALKEKSPALVVCPSSLLANWEREIHKFAPEMYVLVHHGPNRTGSYRGLQTAQVVVSTYETIIRDLTLFGAFEWRWLVCDEAQALKNPDSKRRTALSQLMRTKTLCVTGTPVETSLLDLWSLADLAIPGLLGPRKDFETSYPNTETSAQNLATITNPIVLRRRVADVAKDLPEKIAIDFPLDLGPDLASQYNKILRDTLEEFPRAGALVATNRLQMFCTHPWLQGQGDEPDADVDCELVDSAEATSLMTPKLERTVEIIEEAFENGKKVLVFALFNRCDELIKKAIDLNVETFWGIINGSVPAIERQPIIDNFSSHNGPACLILNPKAAGAGLNITAATVVIHFTQYWNPATESQASARAHRRGQKEPVYVYRLFYRNTLDKIMLDRSEWRQTLGNEAVPVSVRDGEDLKKVIETNPEQ